jgi:hypothetical protein
MTNIVNGLAFRDLCVSNCEDDNATLLDNLQSLLRAPSSSHGKRSVMLLRVSVLLSRYRRT